MNIPEKCEDCEHLEYEDKTEAWDMERRLRGQRRIVVSCELEKCVQENEE